MCNKPYLTPAKGICLLLTSLLLWTSASAQSSFWYPSSQMPAGRTQHAATTWPYYPFWNINVLSSNEIFVFGGFDGLAAQNQAWTTNATTFAYYWSPNTWTTLAPMPTARFGHKSVTMADDRIYVLGGDNGGTFLNVLEIYDPATNTWSTGAPMPTPRAHFALATDGARLFAIGGRNNISALNAVEIYDPATNTWTTGAPMPTARFGIEPLYTGFNSSIIHVPGGAVNGVNAISTIETYDMATNTWAPHCPMAQARAFYAVCEDYFSSLFLSGGFDASGSPTSDLFTLNFGGCNMFPRPSTGTATRVGHRLLTAYSPYQVNIATIGGGFSVGIDSTHNQLYLIVLPEDGLEVHGEWTESGALLHAELTNTDKWEKYRWEKSVDGEHFEPLSDPTSISQSTWTQLDRNRSRSTVFYRLELSATSGERSHSQVIELSPRPYFYTVSPNPFAENLVIDAPGTWTFSLHDYLGRQVAEGSGKDRVELQLGDLASGAYLLTLRVPTGKKMIRIVKN